MATDYSSIVTSIYQSVAGGFDPPAADLATYVALMTNSGWTTAQVTAAIEAEPFVQNVVNPIIREYQAAFGRVPDQGGLQYWVAAVAPDGPAGDVQNVSFDDLATIFARSTEFQDRYGAGFTPSTVITAQNGTALVTALYANVLGRAPDQGGLTFWLSAGATVSQLLQYFSQSQEFINDTASAVAAFQNAESTGNAPASGSLFELAGQTPVVLTTGVDNVSGVNFAGSLTAFLVDGKGATLNPGDVLNGASSNNTLTITDQASDAADVLPAGLTLNNIQNVVLNTNGNTSPAGFSTLGVAGVTHLSVTTAGNGEDVVQAGGQTDITVTHNSPMQTLDSGTAVVVLGGHDVTVTSNADDSNIYVGLAGNEGVPAAANLATGAITVTTNDPDTESGNIHIVGGSSVTVDATSASYNGAIFIGNVDENTGGRAAGALANTAGAITVTDNGDDGEIVIAGGSTVTVTSNGAEVAVGLPDFDMSKPLAANLATGAIQVTTTGEGGDIHIIGGSSVTVSATSSTFDGDIDIGNVSANTCHTDDGAIANTSGAIRVTDAGSGNAINIMGGSTVDVTAAGDGIVIGSFSPEAASDQPTGAVTVHNIASQAYDGVNSTDAQFVLVSGGTDISITTNAGAAVVGFGDVESGVLPSGDVTITSTAQDLSDTSPEDTLVLVLGGHNVTVSAQDSTVIIGGSLPGAAPTGAVSVTETAASTAQDVLATEVRSIIINGGDGVTVSAAGQDVDIGLCQGTSGAQVVTQDGVYTGAGLGSGHGSVVVVGGTDVTIHTTGGDVGVGGMVGPDLIAATGAVNITDTFGSGNLTNDIITVLGGTTVNITVNSADKGDITVGTEPVLNDAGTGLANTAAFATGDVTIVDAQTNDGQTVYGTGAVEVAVNGAQTVSITGGAVEIIGDVQATPATGGPDTGLAIGASTLTTVILDGNQACATEIDSDALTNLTVLDAATTSNTISIYNSTDHTLALTVGNDSAGVTVVDDTATSVTLSDTGAPIVVLGDGGPGVYGNLVEIDAKAMTSFTATNAATTLVDFSCDNKLTTITLNNTGAFYSDLSDLKKLTTVDATGATGAVYVALNDHKTSFNGAGSTGDETVSVNHNTLGDGVTIVGGSGSNTIVADYNACRGDTALGTEVTGFSTLQVATGNVSAHTGEAYDGRLIQQVETFTVGDFGADQNITFAVTLATDPDNPITVSYVEAMGSTQADAAASLAAQLQTLLLSEGFTITYTGGANSFTITGPDDGSSFTAGETGSTVGAVTSSGPTTTAHQPDASYDATGFAALIVGFGEGMTCGDVSFTNVGANVSLTIEQAPTGVVNYLLADATGDSDTLTLKVGADGIFSPGSGQEVTVLTTGIENLDVASLGQPGDLNKVTIGDTAAQSITITGDQDLTLTLAKDSGGCLSETSEENASNVTSIDASSSTGAVDVSGVALKADATHTITGGAGMLTAIGGQLSGDTDLVVSGTGGVNYTFGAGGSWSVVGVNGSYNNAGREGVDLSAATTSSLLTIGDDVISTRDQGVGGVTGFHTGVTSSDALSFVSAKTALANVTTSTSVGSLADFVTASGKFSDAALANLTYTVSNGVITFGAAQTHQLSEFTTAQLIEAAEIIVNNGAGNLVAAFVSADGDTYVVTSDGANALATEGSGANNSSVIELVGMSSVDGFGSTVAAGTILATDVTNQLSAVVNSGTGAAAVYDETGYSYASIDAFGTTSTSITNLAHSAEVVVVQSGEVGAVSISQTGAAGGNSLILDVTNAATFDSLTVNGDAGLYVLVSGSSLTFHSLVDSANTLSSITFAGGVTPAAVAIDSISDMALAKIDASQLSGSGTTFTLGTDHSAIANDGLAVDLSSASGVTSTLWVSGNHDVINQSSADQGVVNITASGLGDAITVDSTGCGNVIVANGDGDVIHLGTGNYTVTAMGSGDTIVFDQNHTGQSSVTVGLNANVTLGQGNEVITITGDVTGATSGGDYAFTTISNFHANAGQQIVFDNATNEAWAHTGQDTSVAAALVNVASATTLAQALDLAAAQGAATTNANPGADHFNTLSPDTGVLDWFQFHGDTYIVESVNSTNDYQAHNALGAHDVVVKLTGLVDLSNTYWSGHALGPQT